MRPAHVIVGAVASIIATVPAFAADKVSPNDIKTIFGTGTPFAASTPSGTGINITLKSDGSALRVPKGGKAGTKGTWRVSDAGYCSKWDKSAENCYTVVKNGKRYDVMDSGGKIAAHWSAPAAAPAPGTAAAAPAPAAAKATPAKGTPAKGTPAQKN